MKERFYYFGSKLIRFGSNILLGKVFPIPNIILIKDSNIDLEKNVVNQSFTVDDKTLNYTGVKIVLSTQKDKILANFTKNSTGIYNWDFPIIERNKTIDYYIFAYYEDENGTYTQKRIYVKDPIDPENPVDPNDPNDPNNSENPNNPINPTNPDDSTDEPTEDDPYQDYYPTVESSKPNLAFGYCYSYCSSYNPNIIISFPDEMNGQKFVIKKFKINDIDCLENLYLDENNYFDYGEIYIPKTKYSWFTTEIQNGRKIYKQTEKLYVEHLVLNAYTWPNTWWEKPYPTIKIQINDWIWYVAFDIDSDFEAYEICLGKIVDADYKEEVPDDSDDSELYLEILDPHINGYGVLFGLNLSEDSGSSKYREETPNIKYCINDESWHEAEVDIWDNPNYDFYIECGDVYNYYFDNHKIELKVLVQFSDGKSVTETETITDLPNPCENNAISLTVQNYNNDGSYYLGFDTYIDYSKGNGDYSGIKSDTTYTINIDGNNVYTSETYTENYPFSSYSDSLYSSDYRLDNLTAGEHTFKVILHTEFGDIESDEVTCDIIVDEE